MVQSSVGRNTVSQTEKAGIFTKKTVLASFVKMEIYCELAMSATNVCYQVQN